METEENIMTLFFTNDSKQKRKLAVSSVAEDLFYEMEMFLEEHRINPHFIEVSPEGKVSFGSMTEHFIIENYSNNALDQFRRLFREA